ncbi:MAG: TerB family tellurite resistance protein [Rhodospirillales bacterium]|nr:TerB family tellurite resistance protein [Rhodospirillales bacterium]
MEKLLTEIQYHAAQAPDEAMFALWRAVFALAHVDGEIDAAERGLIARVMEIFNFSEAQRETVDEDLRKAGDVRVLFFRVEGPSYRAQFFRLARIVIWSDGVLHEDELAAIEAIKDELGDDVVQYEGDLRWMTRKPDLPLGEEAQNPEEEMVKQVIYQMISFYGHMGR